MKIALIGYGKMGKEIEAVAIERGHEIIFKFDKNIEQQVSSEKLKKVDVAVEFTQPEAAYENYLKCFEARVPVVSGTTGWLEKLPDIKHICNTENQTFFYASNFSIGVNIFFRLNKMFSKLMNTIPGYDVSIQETHHIEKMDAPSGTAITLADDLINNFELKKTWVKESTVNPSELVIRSIRKETVPGTHTINYDSSVDYIELTHSAKNRKGFALGAVLAAEFVQTHKGFLGMENLLDF